MLSYLLASKAFDHKDVGVRDAAKSVVLTLMLVSNTYDVIREVEALTS